MARISTACCQLLRNLPNDRAATVTCLMSAKYLDSQPEGECLRFFLVRRYSRRNWLKILAS
jgi:hypothetical protein